MDATRSFNTWSSGVDTLKRTTHGSLRRTYTPLNY
jgi:hypothetical protein